MDPQPTTVEEKIARLAGRAHGIEDAPLMLAELRLLLSPARAGPS